MSCVFNSARSRIRLIWTAVSFVQNVRGIGVTRSWDTRALSLKVVTQPAFTFPPSQV